MPHVELEYPKEVHSTVKRYGDRASYALGTIHGIINSAQILHVSFQPPGSPFPVILPLIGQMGSFARPSSDLGDVLDLYLHGYVSSRIMNLAKDSPSAGLPLCIAASHVDGLVLALAPFSHSYNYRSAVLFGHATVVTDLEEKLWAMELITDSVVPGRWQHTRSPPNGAEMQSTNILRVRISSGSAKIRTGTSHDEKGDLGNDAVLNNVWTGVVPTHQAMADPVPAPHNRVEIPPYIGDFVRHYNEVGKELAIEAVVEPETKT